MNLKAQASFEQLIVVAMALAFVSVAFYLAINYSTDSTKISQAEDVAQRLAGAADHVYALGPNSKEFVTVYLPGDIRNSNITGNRILLTIGTSVGTTDVFANSKADLIGSLPSLAGKQKILVEYLPNGKVRIGSAGLVCSPSLITRSLDPGQDGEDFIYLANNAEFEVTGINASLSGTTLASTAPAPPTLASGANGSFKASYSIPMGQPPGTYGATLLVDSANGGSCTAQITLHVSGSQTCGALCAAGGYATGSCRAAESECLANGEDYQSGNNQGCIGQVGKPDCCCYPTVDSWGPIVSEISHSPPNATASNPITINAICNDTSTGGQYIKSADLQLDGSNWSTMSAADGAFSSSSIENVTRLAGTLGPGQHIAAVRCTDTGNNTGPTSYYYFNVSAGDILGPIVISMNHSDTYPTTLANITEYCVGTDMFTGNANIQRCYIKLDGGSWMPADPADGAWDSPTEEYSYNLGQLATGMHTVYSYCIDSLNNVGGIYNDTFGVSSADVVLVMDRSGSMGDATIGTYTDSTVVNTTSATYTQVKTLAVASNASTADLSLELMANASSCNVNYRALVGGAAIASGAVQPGTSYQTYANNGINVAPYGTSFNITLELNVSAAPIAQSSSKNGGTFADDGSVGTAAWSSASNAQTSNNQYASATLGTGVVSHYLKATGFGFSIPSDATITGIVANFEKDASSSRVRDYGVRLLKAGAIAGSNYADAANDWATYDSFYTYGGPADLWGTAWTVSDINDAGFGVAFSAQQPSGSSTRTAYVDYVNVTVHYTLPAQGSCTVYNRDFTFSQTMTQTKMLAAKTAAKMFVDLVTETTQIGLVSYSTSATTNKQLALMSSANKNALKSSIDALVASGNTCIRCGIDAGRAELTSARSRYPDAVRVAIVLTDGQSNVGTCPLTETIQGGTDAYKSNITIYTIGFGSDVNEDELINVARITGGKYYYAPDAATLQCIYQHIGMPNPC